MIIIEKWVVKQSCVSYQTLSTFTFSELKFLKWISTFYCKIYCKFYTGTSESDYNIDLSKNEFSHLCFYHNLPLEPVTFSNLPGMLNRNFDLVHWGLFLSFLYQSCVVQFFEIFKTFNHYSVCIMKMCFSTELMFTFVLLIPEIELVTSREPDGIYQCFYLLSLLLGDFFLFILELNVYSLLNKDKSLSSMYQVILSNFLFFWELFITEKLFINLT